MQVQGTVVSVELDVQVAKNGGGSYPGSRLAYRDSQGVMKEKSFHNNVFKFNGALKTQLSNLNVGQSFNMEMEKEGDFWNVKSILPAENGAPNKQEVGKTTPYTSPKSTYETPEERAKRQVFIIRQSSIASAIALKGQKASVEEVLKVAKQFEAFVQGEDFDDGMPHSIKNNDIEVN